MTQDEKKAKKEAKKAAMIKEAETLGITYEELKKRQKSTKKREITELDTDEHKTELKRMRTYSKDIDDEDNNKRRRTRSMDAADENKEITTEAKKLTIDEWRTEHQLTLRGHGANIKATFPAPYIEFSDSPFSAKIQTTLTRAGFARPMAIQAQAWPLAVDGKDLISVAKTGSGKTCGFLLPVFHYHEVNAAAQMAHGQRAKPILLVLAPTRELSVQILEEAQKFGRPLGIRSVCCYGGSPKYPQIQAMQRGVECIIATPGRLNDLLEMRKADLSGIKYLVLDEADRMLDMVSAAERVGIHKC
jgi:ATP-dependent RNA helicase DDX5/DBP2